MKKLALTLTFIVFFGLTFSQSHKSFFFPDNGELNEEIPFPGTLSGHTIGEWHFSHDQLVNYLQELSENSERISMWEYGRTYENRPLYLLAFTSPENQRNLDEIRTSHIQQVIDAEKQPKANLPLVAWLGYSVHGNESSPANASMLVAYYLASSQEEEVKNILDSSIVLIDPCMNPDGFTRAATWSNMHIHEAVVSEPADRQFREDWPGGRTNHYWFDLNRDWLPAQHPESKSRLQAFHKWKPHVLTDHHEMGSSSTFFFQPGVPERVNPLTPDKNFKLTKEISKYHAEALDDIGSLYFSEEGFDDFYYGKGSTYPDVNASIGILFEQSRVLGQVIDNPHGELSFADAVKNHLTVSLSTIKAAHDKRKELFNYQNDFYSGAMEMAEEDEVKAYVFGDSNYPVKIYHFLELLKNHSIDVYSLSEDIKINDHRFLDGSSYVVPLRQNQYRLIKSLFEKRTSFEDSVFYDVSTWTMPFAFNIEYGELSSKSDLNKYRGGKIEEIKRPEGGIKGGQSEIGYIAEGAVYNIHAFLYKLTEKGILAKVAAKSFTTDVKNEPYSFSNGSIFIPVSAQKRSPDELYEMIQTLAGEYGIDLIGLETGLSSKGIDMGSWNFIPVEKPEVLVVAGDGVSSRSAGEIWHLLDNRMNMKVVMTKPGMLDNLNLFDYNTIVLPNGHYSWKEETINKIGFWIEEGGTMIAIEDANQWLKEQGWISWEVKEQEEQNDEQVLPYDSKRERRRIESVSGVILKAHIDPSHPLSFGIKTNELPVFKNNNHFIHPSSDPYSTPVLIKDDPLLSGFLSVKNKKNVENTAWVLINDKGTGNVISFVDNPNFRGYWYGTNKVFLNAIFYGRFVR